MVLLEPEETAPTFMGPLHGAPAVGILVGTGNTRLADVYSTSGRRGAVYTLVDPAWRTALRVAIHARLFGKTRFLFTDNRDREVGSAEARNALVTTLGLQLRVAGSDELLCLDRTALAGRTWLIRDESEAELGRVKVSPIGTSRRQSYHIVFDRRLTLSQRRAIVGTAIGLQSLRRWSRGEDVP
ncbi:hypothetical protein [Streptomyces sp. NPDC001292]|uniref:hypothetical protein n=1 Tax=Streptomyces sp. NPDC001292 TaxID=3364558 RepID=UPI0036B8F60F